MFIKINTKKTNKGQNYTSAHIVEAYRENGIVKHRYLANLSKLPAEQIDKIALSFKLKPQDCFDAEFTQGKACGGILTIKQLAQEMGITKALGKDLEAVNLALFQIAGRILCQGSRNFLANQWADLQAIEEVFSMPSPSEDALYKNLDFLAENHGKNREQPFPIQA